MWTKNCWKNSFLDEMALGEMLVDEIRMDE